MRTGGWYQDWRYASNDPDIVLEIFRTNHIYNATEYHSPAFDQAFLQMSQETSKEKRWQLCLKLLQMIDEDHATIRLFRHSKTILLKSRFKGLSMHVEIYVKVLTFLLIL